MQRASLPLARSLGAVGTQGRLRQPLLRSGCVTWAPGTNSHLGFLTTPKKQPCSAEKSKKTTGKFRGWMEFSQTLSASLKVTWES